jgi:hypothetical protein
MKFNMTYTDVLALYDQRGYPFDPGTINIFGRRNKNIKADLWDDVIGVAFPDQQVLAFSGTTDPGRSPLLKKSGVNENGIFILKPGFYANCWHRSLHKGKYKALCQFGYGIFRGWRDNDKDGVLDLNGAEWRDVRGLNLHTTRWDKKVVRVGDFSEACQVVEVAKEYDQIINKIWASSQALYSYALFD